MACRAWVGFGGKRRVCTFVGRKGLRREDSVERRDRKIVGRPVEALAVAAVVVSSFVDGGERRQELPSSNVHLLEVVVVVVVEETGSTIMARPKSMTWLTFGLRK